MLFHFHFLLQPANPNSPRSILKGGQLYIEKRTQIKVDKWCHISPLSCVVHIISWWQCFMLSLLGHNQHAPSLHTPPLTHVHTHTYTCRTNSLNRVLMLRRQLRPMKSHQGKGAKAESSRMPSTLSTLQMMTSAVQRRTMLMEETPTMTRMTVNLNSVSLLSPLALFPLYAASVAFTPPLSTHLLSFPLLYLVSVCPLQFFVYNHRFWDT